MKKKQHNLFFFALVIATLLVGCSITKHSKNNFKNKEEEGKIPLKDRIDLAWAQERQMTQDPALGYVPKERIIPAWDYTKNVMAITRTTAAINNVNWVEVGPKNCGGRSRAVLVDLNDATRKTVFVGSVGGGLWKTTDITQAEPNWQVVNDFFGNIAITSIAQDPSNTQVMYFSTGEGYGNADAIRGLGIWKSTNGGSTWTQILATNNANFYSCQKLQVSSTGVLYVATSSGLQRSADGGASFTKVLGTGLGITGAASNFCYDVEIAANGDVYASLAGTLHKSTNSGVTFGANLPIGITASRIEIGLAPNDANYVYVLCESSAEVSGIALSTNAGTSFTAKTEPADADTGIPATDFSRGQAWYDLTIVVDPNNKDVIFVGGIDLFKSTNGGTSWQQVSHWYGGFGFQEVHADQHGIIFSPGSSTIAYFVNDGGIYRTDNASATTPTLVGKEINYNTTQFYAAAMSPTALSFDFLAGAQDNGSHKFNQSVIQNTTEVTGGDGAFCHIDQNEPQYWFSSYVYNDFYRSTDGGSSFTGVTGNANGMFISPTDYDDVANKMYCSNTSNTYLRWDNPQTGNTFTSISVTAFNGQVSAVKVSPNTSNRVFFGTDGGRVVRVDNANGATPTATNISTGLPIAYVSCVEVETGNDNHLLVTYSNYGVTSIWESTNGGTSWTQVEGNLPDMPVRWALFNPNNNDQAVIATELGVWTTDNLAGASTNWGASNTGLANVRVDMLQLRSSDKLIIAATHGRGLFYSDVFTTATANFTVDKQLTYQGVNINFDSKASYKATSWSWNFGDGTVSTAQNPSKTYTTAGKFNVTLTINSGASTITKNSYIHILPNKGTPYVVATDGGTFEINPNDFGSQAILGGIDKWQRGIPTNTLTTVNSGTNAWKTDLAANLTSGTYTCVLQTPSYNFSSAASAYTLRFRRSQQVVYCNAPYSVQCQYSIDKGITWTRLGVNADANGVNWYERGPATGCPIDAGIFADRYGWTNNVTNSLSTYNLTTGVPALVGQPSVTFRFVLSVVSGYSAAGYAVDGFMIDDFEITGPTNAAIPTWNGTIWSGGTPNATTDAIIASSTAPTATFSCKDLTINSGVSLNTTGITANINGNIVNNGNGISGTGTLNIAANSSISGNNLDVTGVLTVASGATLTTNNLLTLKSTSIANTAMIGNSAGSITGNVTVERFIPAKRAFRLMASGVTTTGTIKGNWQEGQSNANTVSNSNTNAGYGTHITGNSPTTNGFDATVNNNASLFTFNNTTNVWAAAPNTSTANLNALIPYRLFVRGSRAVNLNSNTATADNTVLRATGTVNNAASILFNNASTPTALNTNSTINLNFSMLSNPYWSPVNWATITKANVGGTYYIWDPNMSTRGAYTSWNGLVGSAGTINQYIQPGQAFFITSTSASPSLTIQQSDKAAVAANLTGTFRTAQEDFAKLVITLKYNNTDGNEIKADGTTAIFGNYQTAIDTNEEAYKLVNLDEMLSINRNGTFLSIEARPLPVFENDTLPLQISQYTQSQYKLEVAATNFNYAGKTGFVIDNFLKKSYILDLDGKTIVPVILTTDAASKASNRFVVVLGKPKMPLVVNNLSISLNPNPANGSVQLTYSQPEVLEAIVTITDVAGKLLQTLALGKVQSGKKTIDISMLQKGNYYVKFSNGVDVKIEKLIVQ
jgi:hypothetical protein